jgi:DNA-binding transcriptional ArsR family regulator
MSSMACCSPKPLLKDRPLLGAEQAGELRNLFRILASDTRLRLLHALVRSDELCVNDLADAVGMTPQAVSNQLQRMARESILASRRDGNNVYYRVEDPCVALLLDRALCFTEDASEGRLVAGALAVEAA